MTVTQADLHDAKRENTIDFTSTTYLYIQVCTSKYIHLLLEKQFQSKFCFKVR